MLEFKDAFEERFRVPLDLLLPTGLELKPFDAQGNLWGSEAATREQFIAQGHIGSFLSEAQNGYFLIGFWGHGINSYAIYYCRVDAWSRIFFRLPYGGVYMDNDEMAKKISAFLNGFISFEATVMHTTCHLTAVDAMEEGLYTLIKDDGTVFEYGKTLFNDADFSKLLSGVLPMSQAYAKQISDHRPIWEELYIGRDTD